MRVAVLTTQLSYGGNSRLVLELAHGLQAFGHRVTLALPRSAPADWPVLCPLIRVPDWSASSVPPCDAVIAADYVTAEAAKRSGVRCVIRLVDRWDPGYSPEPDRSYRAIREAPVLWTVSESLRHLIRHHAGREAEVLSPGADPSVFRPRPRPPGPPRVLLLAAPEGPGRPLRRLGDAWAALEEVRRRLPEVQIHVVCRDGASPPGGGWILHGRLTDEALAGLYAQCDTFVYPDPSDEVPLSVIESMASGTPVVTVYGNGIDEVAVSGYNALVAPRGDVERIARYIVQILSDESLRRHLSAGALTTARDRTWRTFYHQAVVALAKAVSTCQ